MIRECRGTIIGTCNDFTNSFYVSRYVLFMQYYAELHWTLIVVWVSAAAYDSRQNIHYHNTIILLVYYNLYFNIIIIFISTINDETISSDWVSEFWVLNLNVQNPNSEAECNVQYAFN